MSRRANAARRRGRRRAASCSGSRARPPWRRFFPIIVTVILALAAPLLVHAQGTLPDSVALGWTDTGDDGTVGTAAVVEIRMSASPISLSNWDQASIVPGVPTPGPSGTPERFVVRGLVPGATYYFALRAADEAGNWSGLSNILMFDGTLDLTPPGAPAGLAVTRVGGGARLTWSPDAEPDLAGYSVYRGGSATGPFARVNDSLLVSPEFDDALLPADAQVAWYRVTALDRSGNESAPGTAVSISLAAASVLLQPAYPNPSPLAGPVHIPLLVSTRPAHARIDVLESGGRRVRSIPLGSLALGSTEVVWDGRNDAGRPVAPGVYSAFLVGDGLSQVVRLVRVP